MEDEVMNRRKALNRFLGGFALGGLFFGAGGAIVGEEVSNFKNKKELYENEASVKKYLNAKHYVSFLEEKRDSVQGNNYEARKIFEDEISRYRIVITELENDVMVKAHNDYILSLEKNRSNGAVHGALIGGCGLGFLQGLFCMGMATEDEKPIDEFLG